MSVQKKAITLKVVVYLLQINKKTVHNEAW